MIEEKILIRLFLFFDRIKKGDKMNTYNGKQINTKRDLVNAIFKQAGINFEGSEKFWEKFDLLE